MWGDDALSPIIALDFWSDLDTAMIEQLRTLGVNGYTLRSRFHRYALLHAFAERTVPQARYRVWYSAEIQANTKFQTHRKALREIVGRLEHGKSLRPYLSRLAVRPMQSDGLLLSWQVHHLHLNTISTAESDGFVARTKGQSDLLLLRIEDNAAYLIDIVPHDHPNLFFDQRWLEIVAKNWPELHTYPAQGITGNDFGPDEIKALRKKNVSYALNVNGRVIFPRPVDCAGVAVETQMYYHMLDDELRNVAADVRRRFYEFFPRLALPPMHTCRFHEVRIVNIDYEFITLQESTMKSLCQARRVGVQKNLSAAVKPRI